MRCCRLNREADNRSHKYDLLFVTFRSLISASRCVWQIENAKEKKNGKTRKHTWTEFMASIYPSMKLVFVFSMFLIFFLNEKVHCSRSLFSMINKVVDENMKKL